METKTISILFLFVHFIFFNSVEEVLAIESSNDINIVDFGAKPDGTTDNTEIIQKAINKCSSLGGGIVYFPAGTYMSGTVFMKNNVTINLHKLAILQGIALESVYPGSKGFVRIDSVSNVSIIGEGTIDGNGGSQVFHQKGNNGKNRPFLVLCQGSKNIVIKDVHLQNAACWTLGLHGSDNIRIDGINIYCHNNWNNDGIDIDSKNVIISNCRIDSQDDALCFKSSNANSCENVAVTNCILASNCNLIKFGTGSVGGFKNISISNCVLRAASESKFWHWDKIILGGWDKIIPGITDSITGISGIAIEVVDGGMTDQVTISNIVMNGIQTPLFIKLGSRTNSTGSLKNVLISNVLATARSRIASSITGVPGFYVENVVIRDMIVNCVGGGTLEDANLEVPENEKDYPENRMFGNILPAYGMYIRHVKNVYLDNIRFNLMQPDYRPAIWFDDAQDVTLRAFKATQPAGDQKTIVTRQSVVKILD